MSKQEKLQVKFPSTRVINKSHGLEVAYTNGSIDYFPAFMSMYLIERLVSTKISVKLTSRLSY